MVVGLGPNGHLQNLFTMERVITYLIGTDTGNYLHILMEMGADTSTLVSTLPQIGPHRSMAYSERYWVCDFRLFATIWASSSKTTIWRRVSRAAEPIVELRRAHWRFFFFYEEPKKKNSTFIIHHTRTSHVMSSR